MISIRGVHRGRGIFFGAGTKDVHINNSIIPEITIRSLNVCKTHKTHTTFRNHCQTKMYGHFQKMYGPLH